MARNIALLLFLVLLSSSSMTASAASKNAGVTNEAGGMEVEGGPYEYGYKYSNGASTTNKIDDAESPSVRGVGLAKFVAGFFEHHHQNKQQKHDHHHKDHPSNSMHRVLAKKRNTRKRNLRKRFYLDSTLANTLDAVQL